MGKQVGFDHLLPKENPGCIHLTYKLGECFQIAFELENLQVSVTVNDNDSYDYSCRSKILHVFSREFGISLYFWVTYSRLDGYRYVSDNGKVWRIPDTDILVREVVEDVQRRVNEVVHGRIDDLNNFRYGSLRNYNG
jgi:hypothetical protein